MTYGKAQLAILAILEDEPEGLTLAELRDEVETIFLGSALDPDLDRVAFVGRSQRRILQVLHSLRRADEVTKRDGRWYAK